MGECWWNINRCQRTEWKLVFDVPMHGLLCACSLCPLYICLPTDLFSGRRSSVSEAVRLQCAEFLYFFAVAWSSTFAAVASLHCFSPFTQIKTLMSSHDWGPLCREPVADESSHFKVKAWSGSEYSHPCFAHCQGLLACPNFDVPVPFIFIFSSPPPICS